MTDIELKVLLLLHGFGAVKTYHDGYIQEMFYYHTKCYYRYSLDYLREHYERGDLEKIINSELDTF